MTAALERERASRGQREDEDRAARADPRVAPVHPAAGGPALRHPDHEHRGRSRGAATLGRVACVRRPQITGGGGRRQERIARVRAAQVVAGDGGRRPETASATSATCGLNGASTWCFLRSGTARCGRCATYRVRGR